MAFTNSIDNSLPKNLFLLINLCIIGFNKKKHLNKKPLGIDQRALFLYTLLTMLFLI